MDEDSDILIAPRRWPLIVGLAATLVWLVLTGVVVIELLAPDTAAMLIGNEWQGALIAIGALLASLTPLALLWFVAVRLRERTGARAAAAAQLAASLAQSDVRLMAARSTLATLDAGVADVAGRIDAAASALAAQAAALAEAGESWTASAGNLAAAGEAATTAGNALLAASRPALARGEALAALLARAEGDMQRHLSESEAMVAALRDQLARAGHEAEARAAATVAALDSVGEASRRAVESTAEPQRLLTEAVDTAFVRTASAMDASRDGVHAQTSALLASIEQARVTLDQIGGEAARQIGRRLETLTDFANGFGEAMATQQARAHDLIETVERGFAVLDAKLGNSVATGNAALETLAVRMTEARDSIHRLGEPLGETHAALGAVEARVTAVGGATGTALAALDESLPAAAPRLEALAAQLDGLYERIGALSAPIGAGENALAAAGERLIATQVSIERTATALSREFEIAQSTLGDIETMAGTTAMAASTQLIAMFGRVRDVAAQTAGGMRETLDGILVEAEAALANAGSAAAMAEFGAPIRASIAELEAMTVRADTAAQGVTERITRQLLALTDTVATVEARIDEADAHYDVRLRDDIANRSASLLASLKDGAIDVAKLLAVEIPDSDWMRYLRGDKGLFARRAVRAIDNGTARAIARHFEHDPPFREQAVRFIDEFEMLLSRVQPGRDGKALAVTLLSSDIGKLYVALGQATARFK